METKYIFQNATYLDHNFNPQKGDVLIKNDEIFKIKNIKDKKSRPIKLDKSYKVIDCENKLLMPGFYNNHAHSAMSLLRGYAENLTLDEWLTKKIFPIEMNFDEESIKVGIELSVLESLKNGIVSIRDMYFFPEITYKTYKKTSIKVNFGRAIIDDNGKKLEDNKSFIEAKEIDDYVKKNTKDSKVKIDYSLHAEYTSTKKLAQELSDYLKNKSNFFNVHISETKKEVRECLKKYKKSPVKYFYDLGLLNSKTVGAHLVHIDDQDLNLLKKSKATVAINPISNLKLSSGVSRLSDFYKNGIKVTIGTDSVASNNSLNIINEVKMAKLLQNERYNDFSITPKMLLNSLTRQGALSQGRNDSGLIKEGYKADLVLIDLCSPNMNPLSNILNNIIYSMDNDNILMTMVDGDILYDKSRKNKYKNLNEIDVYDNVNYQINRLKSKLKK